MIARLIAVSLVLSSGAASAQEVVEYRSFEKSLAELAPICASAPAAACIERGFAEVDRDRDGELTPAEAQILQDQVSAWALARREAIPEPDRSALFTSLLIIQLLGVDFIVQAYDADKDGAVDARELFADVKLDQRPLGVVLSDPDAVRWDSVRARLGPLAPLLDRIVPQPARSPRSLPPG